MNITDSIDQFDSVRKYYNYKVESYERKYREGWITHLHTGIFPDNFHDQKFPDTEAIQSYLIAGQNRLSQKVLDFIPASAKDILDIGCGHGGNLFLLAKKCNAVLHGLTISDDQAQLVKERTSRQGLTDRVTTILGNALTYDFGDQQFDVILGMESFCQIRDMSRLAGVINNCLAPDGLLIISDYYSENAEFKSYFDRHWTCDVKPSNLLMNHLDQYGIQQELSLDLTQVQAPFWKISSMHSEQRLGHVSEKAEIQRLNASQQFHEYMYKAFNNNLGQYLITSYRKH